MTSRINGGASPTLQIYIYPERSSVCKKPPNHPAIPGITTDGLLYPQQRTGREQATPTHRGHHHENPAHLLRTLPARQNRRPRRRPRRTTVCPTTKRHGRARRPAHVPQRRRTRRRNRPRRLVSYLRGRHRNPLRRLPRHRPLPHRSAAPLPPRRQPLPRPALRRLRRQLPALRPARLGGRLAGRGRGQLVETRPRPRARLAKRPGIRLPARLGHPGQNRLYHPQHRLRGHLQRPPPRRTRPAVLHVRHLRPRILRTNVLPQSGAVLRQPHHHRQPDLRARNHRTRTRLRLPRPPGRTRGTRPPQRHPKRR